MNKIQFWISRPTFFQTYFEVIFMNSTKKGHIAMHMQIVWSTLADT